MAELPEVFRNNNLPETVDDLAKFVLIAPEVFKAQQAEIRAMEKVGVAKEIMEIKEADLNRAGQMYMDAKVRLGRITRGWKGKQGQRTDIQKNDCELSPNLGLSKKSQLNKIGISKQRANEFEKLSLHEDLVEVEKRAAEREHRIPSDNNVLKLIREKEETKAEARREAEEPEIETVDYEIQDFEKRIQEDFEEIDKTADIREGFAFIELLDIDASLIKALTSGSGRTPDEAIDYLDEIIGKIKRIREQIAESKTMKFVEG